MVFSQKHCLIFSIIFFLSLLIPGLYTIATNMQDSTYKKITYLKDNFGGKEFLLERYINFKYYNLHESPQPDKVIIGKDGWLFLGDSFAQGHSISLGLVKFSNSELERITNVIRERKKFLGAHNIKFDIAIAPNKQSVYDKYLLTGKYDPNNNTQLLKKYLKSTIDFDLIDLKEAIDSYKDSVQLYYKNDTHWNGIGAFLAFNMIASYIKKDYPLFSAFSFNDYFVNRVKSEEFDLSAMLKLKIIEDKITLEPKFRENAVMLNPKLGVPFSFTMEKNGYEKRFLNSEKRYKIIIFRDSFTSALIPYFKENFNYSLFLWDYDFNKKLILEEKPDIVLYIVAERLIGTAFLE